MSLPQTETPRRARPGAWLLALSPLPFVAWLVAVVTVMSGPGVTESADLTREQMASIRGGWSLIWPLYAVAVIVGCAGTALLNRTLLGTPGHRWAVLSQVACGISTVAILANLVLSEVAGGFTEARLGLNGAFDAALVASYAAIWAAAAAVLLTGVALRAGGVLRRTGPVVAVVAGVFLLLDVLTRGFPPFVVAFLWLAVGVALLRRRVASAP